MKKISLIIILAFLNQSFSQTTKKPIEKVFDGYEIQINTTNLIGKKLELSLYYGLYGDKSISDSITIKSNSQKIVFGKKQKILGAIYSLKFANEATNIDLVVDNGEKMTINLSSPNIKELTVTGNAKNIDFINYQKKYPEKRGDGSLDNRNKIIAKYPTSALSLYFKIQNKIAAELPTDAAGLKLFQETFFADFKLTDERMFIMPNVYQMLFKYVSSFPIDDTNYINSIKKIMGNLTCKTKNYKVYATWFLSNFLYYESYNLEKSFQYFFTTYVDIKNCDAFTDAELSYYRNKSETIKTIPLLSKVPNLILEDENGNDFNLYATFPQYDYTYLAFFSPTCSHCIETMPKVKEYFDALQKNNPFLKLQLITVLNDDDASLWKKFITEKQLENWKNLKSKTETRDFQKDFNTYANPNFVLINKDGTILLKSYNSKALNEVFTRQNK